MPVSRHALLAVWLPRKGYWVPFGERPKRPRTARCSAVFGSVTRKASRPERPEPGVRHVCSSPGRLPPAPRRTRFPYWPLKQVVLLGSNLIKARATTFPGILGEAKVNRFGHCSRFSLFFFLFGGGGQGVPRGRFGLEPLRRTRVGETAAFPCAKGT